MADFGPTLVIFRCKNRWNNRAYPLLYNILYEVCIIDLINKLLEKPEIFLCGWYVASDCLYDKVFDTTSR